MQLPTSVGEFCTGDGILKGEAIGAKTVGLQWEQVHPTGLMAKKLPLAGTRPASEKQRRLAKRIAEAVGIPMPEGTLEDSRAALRFINNHEGALPPSRKQMSFAEALA